MNIADLTKERVRWILDFMAADLNFLRPGDHRNLIDDLRLFVNPADRYVILPGEDPTQDPNFSRENLRNLQQDVRKLLEEMVSEWAVPKNSFDYPLDIPTTDIQAIVLRSHRAEGGPRETWVAVQTASLRAKFLLALVRTLDRFDAVLGLDRVRRCLECKEIFLANHGAQRFCTSQCKTRSASRLYRFKHLGEIKRLGATKNLGETKRVGGLVRTRMRAAKRKKPKRARQRAAAPV